GGIDAATRKLALDQFMSGKPVFGKEGAFGPLLQQLLEAALEGELAGHLKEEQPYLEEESNRRNGHSRKQLRTSGGTIELATPRDRLGSFEPELVKKRQTILADSLEDKILGMYGLGMSLRDISGHLEEIYGTQISHTVLSEITDRIVPQVKAWQVRSLEAVYPIVWLDAMYYKVRDEESAKVVTRCVYNILGILPSGHKEVLGCYVSGSEGARFWLSVLTDLKARGVEDILIACIDNLNGFEQAIKTMYPYCDVQSCIVHQLRNSAKYVASKDQKPVMRDLKSVYRAVNRSEGEAALEAFAAKWGKQYPLVVNSWQNNWMKLSTFFDYPEAIRRVIYTTNTIEGYHRQLRKVTKTKGAFVNDMALLKLIYLAQQRIASKWTMPLPNWALTTQQLKIIFGDRMPISL
ncbi:MAG: transposase, partial [Flaviaesturariibacter sp.]|nr:transposase [Flaviaesturariibacter sp.]